MNGSPGAYSESARPKGSGTYDARPERRPEDDAERKEKKAKKIKKKSKETRTKAELRQWMKTTVVHGVADLAVASAQREAAKRKKPVKMSTVAVEEARRKREDEANRRKKEESDKKAEEERRRAEEAAERRREEDLAAAQAAIARAKAAEATQPARTPPKVVQEAAPASAHACVDRPGWGDDDDDDDDGHHEAWGGSARKTLDGPTATKALRRTPDEKTTNYVQRASTINKVGSAKGFSSSTSPRVRPPETTGRSLDFGASLGLARSAAAGMTVLRRGDKEARSKRDATNGSSDASTASVSSAAPRVASTSSSSETLQWPRGGHPKGGNAGVAAPPAAAPPPAAVPPPPPGTSSSGPTLATAGKASSLKTISAASQSPSHAHFSKAKSWASAVAGESYAPTLPPADADNKKDASPATSTLEHSAEPGGSVAEAAKPESWAAAARGKQPVVENAWRTKPKGALARGFAALQARAARDVVVDSGVASRDPRGSAAAKSAPQGDPSSSTTAAIVNKTADAAVAKKPESTHDTTPETTEDQQSEATAAAEIEASGDANDNGNDNNTNNDNDNDNASKKPATRRVWGGELPPALRAPPSKGNKPPRGAGDAPKTDASDSSSPGDDNTKGGIDPHDKDQQQQQQGGVIKASDVMPAGGGKPAHSRPSRPHHHHNKGIAAEDGDTTTNKGRKGELDDYANKAVYHNHHYQAQRNSSFSPSAASYDRQRAYAGQVKQPHDQHRRSREEAEGAAYQARRASVGRQTEEERRRRIDETSNLDSEAAADRMAARAWAAAQLEESHERREFERRRSAGVMRKRLARDVDDFVRRLDAAMAPQRLARAAVLANVTDVVNSIWAHAECSLYGSCLTGLDLPSSDVDVVVRGLGGDPTPNPPQTLRAPGQLSPSGATVPPLANAAPRMPYVEAEGAAYHLTSPTAMKQRQPHPSIVHAQAAARGQQHPPPRGANNGVVYHAPQQQSVVGTPVQQHQQHQQQHQQQQQLQASAELFVVPQQHAFSSETQHPAPRARRRKNETSEPSDYSRQVAASSHDSNDSDYVAYDDEDDGYEDSAAASSNNDDATSAFGDGSSTLNGKQPATNHKSSPSYPAPSAPPPSSSDGGFYGEEDEPSQDKHQLRLSNATITDPFDDTTSEQAVTNDETASVASSERLQRRRGRPQDIRPNAILPGRREGTDDEDEEQQHAAFTAQQQQHQQQQNHHMLRANHYAATTAAAAMPAALPPQDSAPPFSRHVQSHLAYTARVPHRAATPTRVDAVNGIPRQPYLRSPTPPATAPAGVVVCLKTLAAALSSRPWVRELKAIETASIPVIKLLADPARLEPPAPLPSFRRVRRKPEGGDAGDLNDDVDDDDGFGAPVWCGAVGRCDAGLLAVDISFEAPNHGGLASSRYALETMSRWPEATPLMLVLKELLVQRGLNEPFTGGLSSYSLLLLVITALMQAGVEPLETPAQFSRVERPPPGQSLASRIRDCRALGVDEDDDDDALGYLLTFFLEFFGRQFDPTIQAVSVLRGDRGIIQLQAPSYEDGQWVTPLIEDPLEISRNVARSCFGIAQIQYVFSHCLQLLEIKGTANALKDEEVLSLMLAY